MFRRQVQVVFAFLLMFFMFVGTSQSAEAKKWITIYNQSGRNIVRLYCYSSNFNGTANSMGSLPNGYWQQIGVNTNYRNWVVKAYWDATHYRIWTIDVTQATNFYIRPNGRMEW